MVIGSVLAGISAGSTPASAESLPRIGPAPAFSLVDQNGEAFRFKALHGKVVVVTFIFTGCSDSCPLLTAKLVQVSSMLGSDAPAIKFVAITVDPMNDTPDVLKRYARLYSAPDEQFSFLTGDFEEIQEVVRSYGAYFNARGGRDVDHTFLTSIVDQSGTLRVQYLGWRFNPEEFLSDLKSLVHEDEHS
jgi:protein SCO1/2